MTKDVNNTRPAPANDSDLADLLESNDNGNTNIGNSARASKSSSSIETSHLNLDHLTQSKVDVSHHHNRKNGNNKPFHSVRQLPLLDYLSSYISMLCYYYPVACGVLTMVVISCILVMLGNLVLNPTEEYGVIHHDHSNIQSKYDLSMSKIDHWCLGGGDDKCKCEDPLLPISRAERKSWVESFKANRKLVKQYQDPEEDLDVVFLGESVIEEMNGRWMGQQRSAELRTLDTMFRNNFDKKRGARMQGLPLGIAGDSAPNVLWRMMHGEMPDYLEPKVWWVSVGNNDLARMKCSEEVTVLGILRVVEEILEKKPKARIVINSLFPMAQMRGGRDPLISDFKDSFNQKGGGSGQRVRSSSPNGARASAGMPPRIQPRNPGSRNLRFKSNAYANPLPPRKPNTEADITEQAEEEEVARDKVYRKKHKKQIRQRNKESNVLTANTRKKKMRKYRAQRGFMAKNQIPLWLSIEAINKQLQKFAEMHERVYFFDANDIFTKLQSAESLRGETVTAVDRSKMSNRGHPTELGYSEWEDAVLKRMDKILETMKREQPELFFSQEGSDDTTPISEDGRDPDDDFNDSIFGMGTDDMYAYGGSGDSKPGAGKPTGAGNGMNVASVPYVPGNRGAGGGVGAVNVVNAPYVPGNRGAGGAGAGPGNRAPVGNAYRPAMPVNAAGSGGDSDSNSDSSSDDGN